MSGKDTAESLLTWGYFPWFYFEHSQGRARGCESCRDSDVNWCPHPLAGTPIFLSACPRDVAVTLRLDPAGNREFILDLRRSPLHAGSPSIHSAEKVPPLTPPCDPVLLSGSSFLPFALKDILRDLNRCAWDEYYCCQPQTEGTGTGALSLWPWRSLQMDVPSPIFL